MLDRENKFYLISLSILVNCLPDIVSMLREKLGINHF